MDVTGVTEATNETGAPAQNATENEHVVTTEQKVESKLDTDPNIVDRFAVIARADKRVRETQAKLKEEQKKMDEERAKYKDALDFFESFQKDPLSAIKSKNIKLEELMEKNISLLDDEENPSERKLRELEERLNSEEQFRLDQENKQLESKIQHYKNQLKSELVTAKDEFPLLAVDDDGPNTVYDFIENFYKETGKVLTSREAFDKVHNYLVNELKTVLQLESVKKALGLTDKQPESKAAQNKESHSLVTTTLDDTFTSSTSPIDQDDSDEARRAAAIKLAKSLFNAE
jgi:hypothetical protein